MPETTAPKTEEKKPTQEVKSGGNANQIGLAYTGFSEKTFYDSYYDPKTLRRPYNPDDIYARAGSYRTYEEMLNDDQINVCLQLIKDLVLGGGWSLVPDTDEEKEQAEELEDDLNDQYEGTFDEALEELLSSYEYGVSLTEKVFKNTDDGRIALKFLKTRHPDTFLIHTDDHGNVNKIVQRVKTTDVEINPKSMIHMVNKPKFQNPYGQSDLRAAYSAWFTKRQVIKYYGIFLEKAASPIPIGKYDTNVPKQIVDELFDTIKNFQTKTAMVIPKNLEVDFLESKSNGEAYAKAIDLFNMFIGRSLFVPDLIGLHGAQSSGGSLALGKEQIGIFFKHIERRKNSVENLVNDAIIAPLHISNYGLDTKPPKFKLRPVSEAEAVELAKLWIELAKSKFHEVTEEEIAYFKKLCRFPEGEIELKAPVEPMQFGPDGQPLPPQPGKPGLPGKPGQDPKDKEEEGEEEEVELPKKYSLPPGSYHKKTDFKALKVQLQSYDNSVMAETEPIVKKIIEDLYEQMEKKNILKSEDLSKIDSINLKYLSELKKVFKSSFRDLYKDSKILAAKEINRNDFAKRRPLTPEKFSETIDQETFNYIGDWAYNIKKNARTELTAAIKDGKPLSSVVNSLYPYSESSIERFSRTKHTEVMNRARVDFFDESGVVAALQYSAILDDTTTDVCSELDGKIFDIGTEPVPPLHFNCRSTLVPITKFEAYKVDSRAGGKPIDEYIESNKGEGFSTK